MRKSFLFWGFFFGVLAVMFGALGAHALKPLLTPAQMSSFETALRFQMYHSLLLLILALIPSIANKIALYLLVSGIFLFSFSIYLLSIQGILNWGSLSFLGPITPIGGLLLTSGWLILLYKSINLKDH